MREQNKLRENKNINVPVLVENVRRKKYRKKLKEKNIERKNI